MYLIDRFQRTISFEKLHINVIELNEKIQTLLEQGLLAGERNKFDALLYREISATFVKFE